jgi:hypothetical protein
VQVNPALPRRRLEVNLMRITVELQFPTVLRAGILAASIAAMACTANAQSFAGPGASATTSLSAIPTSASPLGQHKPVADKPISTEIRDGVLSVDGLVVKVQLNYDIKDARCLYFFVPGAGTAIVSLVEIPDSTLEKTAFHGSTLKFQAGGHDIQLTSANPLLGGTKNKTDVYVKLDETSASIARYPMMGYGASGHAPYAWPAAIAQSKGVIADRDTVQAPPLPRDLLPRIAGTVTYTVPATETAGNQHR